MSHVSRIACKIGQAKLLEIYPGAEIVQDIHGNWAGDHWKCDIGLKHPTFQYGIGIDWKGQQNLQIISQHEGQVFDEFQSNFISIYQALATERAMKELGFEVGTPALVNNKVRVEGVRA
jgi:hypothetical protein